MKKYLPFILIGGGVLIIILAVFVVIKSLKSGTATVTPQSQQTENIPELPQSEWPVLSLAPTSDPTIPDSLGHLLDFKVQKINVPGAATMDYLLIYNTTDGGQQGVPGTVQLTGADIDKNLLLGSESSGHYRFDDGVTQGNITITFRDSSGKSLGKLSSDFHLQTGEIGLTSIDGKFSYNLDKLAKGVYFVTMPTFTQPADPTSYVFWQNGYGIFASDGKPHTGTVIQ
jgi:hypothetical protein